MMILISNSEARLSSSVAIAVLHAVCLPATCTRHLAQLDGPSLHCMHVALQGQSSKEQRDERCVTPVCWTAKNGKKPITEAVIADYELPTFHMGGGMWNVRCRNIRHCPRFRKGYTGTPHPAPCMDTCATTDADTHRPVSHPRSPKQARPRGRREITYGLRADRSADPPLWRR